MSDRPKAEAPQRVRYTLAVTVDGATYPPGTYEVDVPPAVAKDLVAANRAKLVQPPAPPAPAVAPAPAAPAAPVAPAAQAAPAAVPPPAPAAPKA